MAAPTALRKRMAIELVTLVILAPLFLYFVPRNVGLYSTAAVLFFGFVAISTMKQREYIWPAPTRAWQERLGRSMGIMFAVTTPTVLLFYGWSLWMGYEVSFGNLLLAFCLYFPWALLQQSIFMIYLLGRLRTALPSLSPPLLAGFNGAAYGLVHLPDKVLVLVTIIAGTVWSYAYLRDRQLLPLALSHAVLGSTFYYFVGARDLYQDWLMVLNRLY
ncbi:MAG: CPBP family glutamic-type intramembrane protease [Acidiferrobacterales bacterium]|nr:CPBP family glutamic-type intramembrane protease [Acidiferrobacterales bacterium]